MKYIYGLNKNGQSIIDYLDSINEDYYCWDDNVKIRKKIQNYNNKVNLVNPINLDLQLINECFVTPGISFNSSKIEVFKKNNINLFRDLELYTRLTKDKKIIAITGTNGKSTTTKLISDILTLNKIKNFAGGNFGLPLLDYKKLNNKIKFHVIELSSFQLESAVSFNSFISILLNISPDHLDRYKNFSEYILQKEKIINLNKNGFNIISLDDPNTINIYNKNKEKFIPISNNYIERGVYIKDNFIIINYFYKDKAIKIPSLSPSLFGFFNKQNILAAYVVVKILNLDIKNFIKIIKEFIGLPHRLEKIYQNDYLQVINNSKATNVDASIKSIMNYDNISLILGGKDNQKDKKFNKIIKYKNKIKKVYLIGEASIAINKQLKNEINCEICKTLEIAIKKIFLDVKKFKTFQTILFAPACTSFDQFKNYEDRGEWFIELIAKVTKVKNE